MILGLASANLVVVKNCAWLSGPPITSGDDSTTCAPGTFFSSRNVNGRDREVSVHLVLGIGERRIGVGMAELHGVGVELGPLIGTKGLGRRDLKHDRLGRDLDGRHRDLVAGPKSLIDLMLASRLINVIGCAEVATIPFTPPRVRSHSKRRLPVPVLRMSTPPASSASVCAPPPEKVTHLVVTPDTPSEAACFSISFCFSMMWLGM
jgi:hypothetical protein